MAKIHLEKYPVISKNEITYAVSVCQDSWGLTYAIVYRKGQGIFGRTRHKRLSNGVWDGWYSLEDWDYDFIRIAKYAVAKYEESTIERDRLIEKGVEKFNEWDGDCR